MKISIAACSLLLTLLVLPTWTVADDESKEKAKPGPLPWLTRLTDGTTEAQKRKQPIFVRVNSASCVWCRKLEKGLEEPKLQEELARWTLVSLDVDRLGPEQRNLVVGAVPALRLLSPTGRVMVSRDGYLEPDKLTAWLKENYEKAAALPDADLAGDGVPTPEVTAKLIGELKNRDPAARETAIRRLLPYPALAAPAVADAFAKGSLQTRLTALELLREWKAPVQNLDPWQPETLKAERLDALRRWAAERPPAAK